MYSPEFGQAQFDNAFSNKAIRQGFIRKVYSILSVQLFLTLGFVFLFSRSNEAKKFAENNIWLFFVAIGVMIISLLSMICIQSLRRKTPHNFILLALFTLAQGVILGFFTSFIPPEIVQTAVLITAFVVLGLTIFAFQTKWDFTILNGVMFALVLVLMIFGLILSFTPHNKTARIVYSSLGAFIFCVYLIIDTQSIVGGNHKYQISCEEYIFAALTLYMDIVNLFTYILTILNETNN